MLLVQHHGVSKIVMVIFMTGTCATLRLSFPLAVAIMRSLAAPGGPRDSVNVIKW